MEPVSSNPKSVLDHHEDVIPQTTMNDEHTREIEASALGPTTSTAFKKLRTFTLLLAMYVSSYFYSSPKQTKCCYPRL
jgi:hypothetical protein